MTDRRQYAPATARNREPILAALRSHLPTSGTVLEIASGTGEHAVFFAPNIAPLKWQPSNVDNDQLKSVTDWIRHCPAENLLPPLQLDAADESWPVEAADYAGGPINAIFNANMIHISPWYVCKGLLSGAGRILPPGGKLFLYGPFKLEGNHTAPSNSEFEFRLKSMDLAFAIRDLEDVATEGAKQGLQHRSALSMPANNFLQIFEKI
ncbi:MAG: DUF938 domain-containing protein [Sneathiella sp.]|nr:DUF938 domain-containing protein [Sneathiella sp.]